MNLISSQFLGIIIECPECHAIFSIDPHNDLYEEKYVYCPICKHRIDSGIREAQWEYAVGNRKEAQPNDKENTNCADNSDNTSSRGGRG